MNRIAFLLVPLLLLPGAARAEGKVVVVRSGEAEVVTEITKGFRASFPGDRFEDILLADPKSEAGLARRLDGATSILAIGTRAALAVSKAAPAGTRIAVVPPTQADPAAHGPTMRLQPPPDGIIASVAWMGGRFRRVGLILDASATERQKIAEVEAQRRGIKLTAVLAKDGREVVKRAGALLATNDLLVVDVSDGIQASDVLFMVNAAQDAQIPLIGTSEAFVRSGAPGAITIDPRTVGAEAGRLARDKAAGMFDPRRFRVLVNTVAMERIGVRVPTDRGTIENNILTMDTDADELGRAARPVVVTRPSVLKQARLSFPQIAPPQIRSADVVLEVLVKADGTIADTKVLKGDEMFAKAALDSLKGWQFKPGTRDGTPVEGALRLNLKFQR